MYPLKIVVHIDSLLHYCSLTKAHFLVSLHCAFKLNLELLACKTEQSLHKINVLGMFLYFLTRLIDLLWHDPINIVDKWLTILCR